MYFRTWIMVFLLIIFGLRNVDGFPNGLKRMKTSNYKLIVRFHQWISLAFDLNLSIFCSSTAQWNGEIIELKPSMVNRYRTSLPAKDQYKLLNWLINDIFNLHELANWYNFLYRLLPQKSKMASSHKSSFNRFNNAVMIVWGWDNCSEARNVKWISF